MLRPSTAVLHVMRCCQVLDIATNKPIKVTTTSQTQKLTLPLPQCSHAATGLPAAPVS
jgi:hypothetical protein